MSIPGQVLFYDTFTSDGAARTLSFGTNVSFFQMWNLTQFNSVANPGVLKRAWFVSTQPSGSYFGVVNTNGAATDQSIYAATNGFTPFDYDNLGTFATSSVSSVTQANPAVVTTGAAHGLTTGDTVVFANVTGMQQISGIEFTVTVTGATTFTIPINTSGFAAAGSGGTVRRIYQNPFVKRETYITNITQAASAVISTSTNHGYAVGDVVSFRLPSSGYGMTQLNYLRGSVTAVTATTLTVDIDSTGFTAWAWPTSANAFLYSRPVVLPVGAAGTSPNYLGDATDNQGFKGLTLGSAVVGASSDVIHWVAGVGTQLSAI